MFYTDVAYDCFIQTNKVKFVLAYTKTKAVSTLVTKAEESFKLINMTSQKSTLSLVVLEDDTVLRSPLKPETIYERLKENGHQLYKVDSDYFISVIHIKAIYASASFMAMNVKKQANIAGNDLQFIRQRERRQTQILMTTGETVCLSKYTKDIVKELNEQFIAPNKL